MALTLAGKELAPEIKQGARFMFVDVKSQCQYSNYYLNYIYIYTMKQGSEAI